MTVELALTIGLILGLAVGIAIDRQARRERDERIRELERRINNANETMQEMRT